MNVSAHPAPIIERAGQTPIPNAQTIGVHFRQAYQALERRG
jgi:hypothetical protein